MAIRKLQKQNTELIRDADKLRGDYNNLKNKVKQLEEKFKELTGISLTNVQDIEREIKKCIHPSGLKTARGNSTVNLLNPANNLAKDSGMNSMLGDLQKNKQVMEQQNAEISKLQVFFIILNKK